MSFKKRQPKQQQRKKSEPDGKISLWSPRKEAKYVISGTVFIGEEKYRVFIYENDDPLYENSPEYYGSLYLDAEEEEVSEPRGKKYSGKTTKVSRYPKAHEQGFDEDADDEQEDEDDDDDRGQEGDLSW